ALAKRINAAGPIGPTEIQRLATHIAATFPRA
ncbi:MAG: hypothetical protein JWN65_2900, partial [Solirubrobacterales bacterium]|nr:hypothetical protein [Solirubrobacterales bacterium]